MKIFFFNTPFMQITSQHCFSTIHDYQGIRSHSLHSASPGSHDLHIHAWISIHPSRTHISPVTHCKRSLTIRTSQACQDSQPKDNLDSIATNNPKIFPIQYNILAWISSIFPITPHLTERFSYPCRIFC